MPFWTTYIHTVEMNVCSFGRLCFNLLKVSFKAQKPINRIILFLPSKTWYAIAMEWNVLCIILNSKAKCEKSNQQAKIPHSSAFPMKLIDRSHVPNKMEHFSSFHISFTFTACSQWFFFSLIGICLVYRRQIVHIAFYTQTNNQNIQKNQHQPVDSNHMPKKLTSNSHICLGWSWSDMNFDSKQITFWGCSWAFPIIRMYMVSIAASLASTLDCWRCTS